MVATSDMERRGQARPADLTLNDIRENPAAPYDKDEVTRLIEADLDKEISPRSRLTVAQLREHVLSANTTGEESLTLDRARPANASRPSPADDQHDLALGAAKIRSSRTRTPHWFARRSGLSPTTHGQPGRHPGIDHGSLSWGMGDALTAEPGHGHLEATSAIRTAFTTSRGLMSDPDMLPGPHHDPDGGAAPRHTDGRDVPEPGRQ